MKRVIIKDGKPVKCPECGNTFFRVSTRSKYTDYEKKKGVTYDIRVCSKCGHKEIYNKIEWIKSDLR